MAFVDKINIKVRAGKGGDGAIAFLREKYRPNGGPAGGNGGRGGSVYFVADSTLSTLMDFQYRRKIVASSGENGRNKNQYGKKGDDIIIKVPVGTIVKNLATGLIIADFDFNGKMELIAKGGRGGRGNASFSTPVNQMPKVAENGISGEEKDLELELLLLADIGLVGLPNAGKSSLLNVITNAKSIIGDYPFTTLVPNLGVARINEESFVIADLPGLIEGARSGKGLGIEFLRHIERCRVLIFVLDITDNPIEAYDVLQSELNAYNLDLLSRPSLIALNKSDEDYDKKIISHFEKTGKSVFLVSALTRENLDALMMKSLELLQKTSQFPISRKNEMAVFDLDQNETDYIIERIKNNCWHVTGDRLERIFKKINLSNEQGINFLMMIVKEMGIEKELISRGIIEGDEVIIIDYSFIYYS